MQMEGEGEDDGGRFLLNCAVHRYADATGHPIGGARVNIAGDKGSSLSLFLMLLVDRST